MRFAIKAVEPIGTRFGWGFVHRRGGGGCGPEMIASPDYPPSPGGDLLRKARVDRPVRHHVTLGEGARRLGMRAEQLSGLEHGRYTFEDPGDFERAAEILRAPAEGKVET